MIEDGTRIEEVTLLLLSELWLASDNEDNVEADEFVARVEDDDDSLCFSRASPDEGEAILASKF